jgi:hypothetical protein
MEHQEDQGHGVLQAQSLVGYFGQLEEVTCALVMLCTDEYSLLFSGASCRCQHQVAADTLCGPPKVVSWAQRLKFPVDLLVCKHVCYRLKYSYECKDSDIMNLHRHQSAMEKQSKGKYVKLVVRNTTLWHNVCNVSWIMINKHIPTCN